MKNVIIIIWKVCPLLIMIQRIYIDLPMIWQTLKPFNKMWWSLSYIRISFLTSLLVHSWSVIWWWLNDDCMYWISIKFSLFFPEHLQVKFQTFDSHKLDKKVRHSGVEDRFASHKKHTRLSTACNIDNITFSCIIASPYYSYSKNIGPIFVYMLSVITWTVVVQSIMTHSVLQDDPYNCPIFLETAIYMDMQ